MVLPKPDHDVCIWWDWKQPCGTLVRIRYMPTWKNHDRTAVMETAYPWHSIERAYSQASVDFIGGRFKACPLEDF